MLGYHNASNLNRRIKAKLNRQRVKCAWSQTNVVAHPKQGNESIVHNLEIEQRSKSSSENSRGTEK